MSDRDSAPAPDVLAAQTAPVADATTSTVTPTQDPQLTLADLQNILVIINTASKRGAFQGAELSQVGGVYQRIEDYIKHVTKNN